MAVNKNMVFDYAEENQSTHNVTEKKAHRRWTLRFAIDNDRSGQGKLGYSKQSPAFYMLILWIPSSRVYMTASHCVSTALVFFFVLLHMTTDIFRAERGRFIHLL